MWLLLLALVLCAPDGAQRQPAAKTKSTPAKAASAPAAWPIETLTVEGNRDYTQAQILAIAGLKTGQLVTKSDFETARDRLGATGRFESISFRYSPAPGGKGYAVSFQVAEAGPLFPVRFEDLGVPSQQMEQALRQSDPLFGPKVPATRQTLERYTKVIEDFLAARNRNEKVLGKLVPGDTGELAIVFRPAVLLPAVARVKFTGIQVIPASSLQNTANSVAVGLPYQEPRFRLLLDNNIRPLYEARGRVRVTFPQIQTEKAPDVDGLIVTVKVDEGASYNIGEVRVDGSALPAKDLLAAGDIKTGDLANFDQIKAGVARMEQRYRREGYMKVSSRVDRKINDQPKTVDLTIHFDPGPQYMFGKLSLEGLDINGEAAVRKLWALQGGKRFNADYPNYFLEQIREGGIFDNLGKTKAVLDTNEETRTVNVKLVFAGAPPAPPDRFGRQPD